MKNIFKPFKSPNFNDRIGYEIPDMIVLHYTSMQTAKAALQHLCDPASQVSAHYVIEENGKIHNLVIDEKRAWHAGLSHWAGETDINSASIGIEIVNKGHDCGYETFPEAQINAVIKLCKALMAKYAISPARILGHSDVAISRKIDPGHLFPWDVLAQNGIGLWPSPEEMDYQAAEDLILTPDALHELLCGFGYDFTPPIGEVIRAFHRHYMPEKFSNVDDTPDEPDVATCAKLLSLIRQSHETS